MAPNVAVMFVCGVVLMVVTIVVLSYRYEKKMDERRRDKSMMRGWRYESARGNRQGFVVEGYGESYAWRLEERRSGGKNDQRPLFFIVKDLRYNQGVFVFGSRMEVGMLKKPFMQYIIKLGAKMTPTGPDSARIEALSHLDDAQEVEVPDSGGKWKYGAIATHPEFALKALGSGLQAEYDSLSMLKGSNYPPSIMLSGEGMEMKWPWRGIEGEKLETIVDYSVRIMGIIGRSMRE